ncbi:beta strand repeat-containing protein [Nocardioides ultimimeridianus]
MNSRNSRSFRLLAGGTSVATLLGTVVATATIAAAPSFAAGSDTAQTFSATGSVQDWTVPAGVTQLYVDISGAQGGASFGGGGGGAELTGTLSVTPGETLHIIAGGMGQDGIEYGAGAGGGGGSFIYTTADQSGILAAAGGGGGAGSNRYPFSASTGTSGTAGDVGGGAGGTGGSGGGGGGGFGGGAGGGGGLLTNGGDADGGGGQSVAAGASGGSGFYGFLGDGGFGGGGGSQGYAGGGGGGYSGGGGGTFDGSSAGGGGGGGSYFAGTLTGAVTNHGGAGVVTVYYPSNLTSVSPTSGKAGDSVTIDGTGLAGATVTIGGLAATVTSSTDTEVVATVPAPATLPTDPQTVGVTTAGGVTLPAVGAFSYLPAPLFTADSAPSTATVGMPYSYTFTASGGPTFAVSSGTLPAGLTLASDGVLSGTPTGSGASTFTVAASNGVSPDAISDSQTITVGPGAQAITFTPLTSPATVGDQQTLSAVGGASGNPVAFAVGSGTTGAACSITGTTVTFDHAGSCVVTADQAGDDDYAAAPEVPQTVTVDVVATSVSVALGDTGTVVGQSTSATATVADGLAGTVQFSVDGNAVGAPVTVTAGQATIPAIGTFAPGAHQVGATFTPSDPTSYGSSSAVPQTLTVDQAATTSTLTLHADSLTVTVAPVAPGAGTPSGTVTFSVDGSPVGTAVLASGVGTLSYALPTGKADQVSVEYAGDADFLASSASTTRHDPTITATLSSAHPRTRSGWYRSPVTVHFTCATNGAGLTAPCPGAVTLSRNAAAQSVARTIRAVDGGVATVAVSGIDIDRVRPTVAITGIDARAPYFASAPVGHCDARDTLSGVASCSLTQQRRGTTEVYTATARDRAGNVATTRRTVRVSNFVIAGAPFRSGAYVVHAGHTSTLLAAAATAPRYVDAMPSPRRPVGEDNFLHRIGRGRWAIGVTFSPAMLHQSWWNIGVRVGDRLHVIRIHVVR